MFGMNASLLFVVIVHFSYYILFWNYFYKIGGVSQDDARICVNMFGQRVVVMMMMMMILNGM